MTFWVFQLGIFLMKLFKLIREKSTFSNSRLFLWPHINQSIFYAMLQWSKDNPIILTLTDQNHPYRYHSIRSATDSTHFPLEPSEMFIKWDNIISKGAFRVTHVRPVLFVTVIVVKLSSSAEYTCSEFLVIFKAADCLRQTQLSHNCQLSNPFVLPVHYAVCKLVSIFASHLISSFFTFRIGKSLEDKTP